MSFRKVFCSSRLRLDDARFNDSRSQLVKLLIVAIALVGCVPGEPGDPSSGGGSGSTSAPSIATFTATTSTITAGNSTTLRWTVSNATSITINNGVGAVNGTEVSVTPTATTTYILTATNAAGSTTASTTVTVAAVALSMPTITSFTASPATITVGGSTTLNWTAANATSLSINNGIGTVMSAGRSVSPTQTTTYTLTASNASGSATATVTVTVNAAPQPVPTITSFTVSPLTITAGASATLNWVVSNATSLIINGVGTVTGTSVSVKPTQTTTYTLTATNANGSATSTAKVTVNPAAQPAPVITSFTAAPSTITAGAISTLNWTVENATSLSLSGIGAVTGTSRAVAPAQTTTYTLIATNGTTSVTRSVTVTVSGTTPPAGSSSKPVPNGTVPTSWSFCSERFTGTGCEFDGMRQVRIGTGNKWIVKKVLHRLDGWNCSNAFFGGDAAPGQAQHCEVANIREEGTLDVPVTCYNDSSMCAVIDLTKIPLGSDGFSELRIQPTSAVPQQVSDGGSFRTECEYSHMAFNDPIVYPGQPGRSHLHVFFGNTDVDAFSTPESIANSGNSTCGGGIANRTAYWIPAVIDTRNGAPVVPDNAIWYYKTFKIPANPISANQPLPSGLRMIAGDMHATGAQSMTEWSCSGTKSSASIPTNCGPGEFVELSVTFPACWDGVNLDSADHKSHMSFGRGGAGCPATHPVPVPEIKLNVRYLAKDSTAPAHWRLSSDHTGRAAGLSAHADWFDGWIPSVRDTWVKNCSQKLQNCEVNNLGDGTRLY